jgi:hypothetical protein
MLLKSPSDAQPTITIQAKALLAEGLPQVERFGLSENQRRAVFTDVVLGERTAQQEVDKKYPPLTSSPHDMEMSSDLFRQLVEKNEVCVAEKHRLTRAQVKAICSEALDGNWPMPAER